MFSVFSKNEDGFDKIILKSETSTVEIVPNCGGILNAWHVQNNTALINVIEGYDSEEDFKKNCEKKGFRSAKLSPFVCRMAYGKYNFGNQDFKVTKFFLNEHAIHGLVYNADFEPVHQLADETGAVLQLEYCYAATDEGFPFQFTIMLEYILQANNLLTLNTYILNQHSAAIPLADGWHPYFKLGENVNNLSFCMASNKMVEFDETLIPTGKMLDYKKFQVPEIIGETFLDNCFELNAQNERACQLESAELKLRLEIFANEGYPFLQVYTPPNRKSIAIENLSSAPDSFNNGIGIMYLQPNDKQHFSTSYQISTIK
jgi:aldose 1-epimerase